MNDPRFSILRNPFCPVCARNGHDCWRALDRACGSFLAVHAASPAAAQREAVAALPDHRRHDCRPLSHPVSRFRPDDDELDDAWRDLRRGA